MFLSYKSYNSAVRRAKTYDCFKVTSRIYLEHNRHSWNRWRKICQLSSTWAHKKVCINCTYTKGYRLFSVVWWYLRYVLIAWFCFIGIFGTLRPCLFNRTNSQGIYNPLGPQVCNPIRIFVMGLIIAHILRYYIYTYILIHKRIHTMFLWDFISDRYWLLTIKSFNW